MALVADESAAMPGATAGAARASEAVTGVDDAAPKSEAEKPMVPEEPTTLPEASEGVVGHVVWPRSPLVVPPAAEEEEEVEEIEREES